MSERLTVGDVKGDILDAFDMLKERAGRGAALEEANNSETRVLTFLVQCEADQKRLERARKACMAIAEATTKAEITQARGQALDALAD